MPAHVSDIENIRRKSVTGTWIEWLKTVNYMKIHWRNDMNIFRDSPFTITIDIKYLIRQTNSAVSFVLKVNVVNKNEVSGENQNYRME